MITISSIWHKYLGGKESPWADINYINGQMVVNSHNQLFVDNLRVKFGNLTDGLDDAQVIQLLTDRENIEIEPPRLDVKHAGIMEDGRIKMELDWNPAFIRHLAENGIQAETEEEAVQLYLQLISHQAPDDIVSSMLSREDIDSAFADIDKELKDELNEASRQVQENSFQIKQQRNNIRNY